MIRKFMFGTPINTEAAAESEEAAVGSVPFVEIQEGGTKLFYEMDEADIIYGLGENIRGINKRGWIYESRCNDDPQHTEDIRALYGAHNFFVLDGKACFGVFLDYPGIVQFDMGYSHYDRIEITLEDANYVLYVITGENPADITKQFRKLIGRSYIPPRWAFGYGQSRWSYKTEEEVLQVLENHKRAGIPLDAVYLDIDYMEHYKDFTVDKEAFPDLKKLSGRLACEHVHLVPIIDAGVKVEPGYEVYEEGLENGYFCKNEDGSAYVGAAWPDRVHYPDVLNANARKWFGEKYQYLCDMGIEGFWNDMNEPSIFYSEDRLMEFFRELENYTKVRPDMGHVGELRGKLAALENNPEDYKKIWHDKDGKRLCHRQMHNLFGYNMTRAAGEAFERLYPDKRILLFSRSSYIGMHRYGGIWTGDNRSWWSHLLLNIKMMPSLNMCGFLFSGADIGGFGSDTTEDLLMRWLEFGIFTPLLRNHSAMYTRRQELYAFDRTEALAGILKLRYRLLPYLYSEFVKAAVNFEMYLAPLSFAYPKDSFASQVEDQLLVGESIMIAPVYEQNARGRYVYLPERMKLYVFQREQIARKTVLEAGHHYIEVSLEETAIFVRPGHLLPLCAGGLHTEELDWDKLQFLGMEDEEASYLLYNDDGYEKDYENPEHYTRLRKR